MQILISRSRLCPTTTTCLFYSYSSCNDAFIGIRKQTLKLGPPSLYISVHVTDHHKQPLTKQHHTPIDRPSQRPAAGVRNAETVQKTPYRRPSPGGAQRARHRQPQHQEKKRAWKRAEWGRIPCGSQRRQWNISPP